MGFMRKNYEIEDNGIILPEAYAQINNLSVNIDGMANAMFVIQKDRDSVSTKKSLDTIVYRCEVDKNLPIFKQVYENAKKDIFNEWTDDIVEE